MLGHSLPVTACGAAARRRTCAPAPRPASADTIRSRAATAATPASTPVRRRVGPARRRLGPFLVSTLTPPWSPTRRRGIAPSIRSLGGGAHYPPRVIKSLQALLMRDV